MSKPTLLNPDGKLSPEIEASLFLARKTKSLWAKLLEEDQTVETREGVILVKAGNYMCRGIENEEWPQTPEKLFEKYLPVGEPDEEGWQRFDPKPDASPVQATKIDRSFRIVAHWGELTGIQGDYLVRSTSDPTDVWIVGEVIFEASYEPVEK